MGRSRTKCRVAHRKAVDRRAIYRRPACTARGSAHRWRSGWRADAQPGSAGQYCRGPRRRVYRRANRAAAGIAGTGRLSAPGIAISLFTPGFVGDVASISQLAELGVIFLMFGVGLHCSLRDLWAVRAIAIPGAVGQIIVITAIGFALSQVWGWSAPGGLHSGARGRSIRRGCEPAARRRGDFGSGRGSTVYGGRHPGPITRDGCVAGIEVAGALPEVGRIEP